MLTEVASLIGAITGTISIIGFIFLIGYWKGGVDAALREWKKCQELYPPAQIMMMLKTLWDAYIVDPLKARPDLASHSSPYKLTKAGVDLIPDDVKNTLDQVKHERDKTVLLPTGWLVVDKLGLMSINALAYRRGLSLQETIAILSVYIDSPVDGINSG